MRLESEVKQGREEMKELSGIFFRKMDLIIKQCLFFLFCFVFKQFW